MIMKIIYKIYIKQIKNNYIKNTFFYYLIFNF